MSIADLHPIDGDALRDGALDAGDLATAALVILADPRSIALPLVVARELARIMRAQSWTEIDHGKVIGVARWIDGGAHV